MSNKRWRVFVVVKGWTTKLSKRRRLALLEQLMPRLPKNYRVALELRYLKDEKSVEQIAKFMGTGEGAVKMYLFRGCTILKKLLEDAGETPGERLSKNGKRLGRPPKADSIEVLGLRTRVAPLDKEAQ